MKMTIKVWSGFIKMKLKTIRNEILYLLYSKKIFIFLIILFVALTICNCNEVNLLQHSYKEYLSVENYYIKQGDKNIQKYLNKDLNITHQESNGATITNVDNPLKYNFMLVGGYFKTLKPNNMTISLLELLTFFLGPFIFGLFGVLLATYDFKYKTIKLKSLQQSWSKNVLTKLLISIVCTATLIIFLFAISQLVSNFIYIYANTIIPNSKQFTISDQNIRANRIAIELLISIFICSMFSIIGFTLGLIFKSSTAPIIILAVYNFALPNLGKYDLKNLLSIIGHKYFEFDSNVFSLFTPVNINSIIAITILIAFYLLLICINIVVSKNQSKYIV
jgi:hypothetical protein